MKTNTKSTGKKGEDMACKYLKKDKYKILVKNYRTKQGELDIVAEDKGGVLCFVEVKARSSTDYGAPEEAVTRYKQKRLLATAFNYLESKQVGSKDMRFDVVTVDLISDEIKIIKNALEVNYF